MIDKKYIKLVIVVSLVIVFVLSSITVKNNKISKDERYFRIEYEKYNKKKKLDGSDYLKIDIIDKNGIDYVSSKRVVEIMNKETGIIYLGYPQGFRCRSIVPILIDVTNEYSIDKIYYYNAYGDRDEKYIDNDGKINTLKEGSKDYNKILELLKDKINKYEEIDDDTSKRLYFPTVLFIKNGKVVEEYISDFDDENSNKKLSKKEKNKIKQIFINGVEKISSTCEGDKLC